MIAALLCDSVSNSFNIRPFAKYINEYSEERENESYSIISSLLLRPHTNLTTHTPHQDDTAPFYLLLNHMLSNFPRTEKRAIKVDIHQLPPSSIRIIFRSDVIDYSGGCDQDINLPKVFDNLGDGRFNLGFGGNIARVWSEIKFMSRYLKLGGYVLNGGRCS